LRLCENRRLNKETNLSQSRKDAKAPPLINARLNSRRRYAMKMKRFHSKDRVMTGAKDRTPGYLCPGYDLSVTSR
jgi:hypothetical protein